MNNGPNRMMMRVMGPYAFFATLLSFMLPPIGFLLAFRGYWLDKHNGERYGGWIFLMVIAVFSSIIILIVLIVLLNYSNSSNEEAAVNILTNIYKF